MCELIVENMLGDLLPEEIAALLSGINIYIYINLII